MPGKSRHGKRKHSTSSKKRKINRRFESERQYSSAIPAPQQAVARPAEPAPSATVSAPAARPIMAQYPYIATELWRIGILAGIMVIILVILALVLS